MENNTRKESNGLKPKRDPLPTNTKQTKQISRCTNTHKIHINPFLVPWENRLNFHRRIQHTRKSNSRTIAVGILELCCENITRVLAFSENYISASAYIQEKHRCLTYRTYLPNLQAQ